nr:MAG TPA: tail protein [Caudoviricetes sp.]
MMEARRCLVMVSYNGKDISADLQQYLKSVSYTDNMSGEADDLQLTLEDKAGLWQSAWMPEKGATLDVSVKLINWQSIGEQVVRFGLFEIDEITSSGMPSEVQIKAISVPDNNNLRGVERTRSWEKAELKRIANDIAGGAGLELYYDVKDYNPVIDRAEQSEQSDLSFLYQLCVDHGLALKICNNQLVIFDEADYEAADAVAQLPKPGTIAADAGLKSLDLLMSYSLSSKVRDVYKACHVKYQEGKDKQKIEATFAAPGKTTGKTLEVNEQVTSIADAERLAKKKLREKNSAEISGTFTFVGYPELAAAVNIMLSGFGVFDGKYIIIKAQHDIGSGYTTRIDVRRCLDGY